MKTDPPPAIRTQVIELLGKYAVAQSSLKAATASFDAQVAQIESAVATATAVTRAEIEQLEKQLKALALEHGDTIFGDARSLIVGGFKLGLKAVEAVELEGDEDFVCRQIVKRIKEVEAAIATAKEASDSESARTLGFELAALSGLVVTTHKINREFVKAHAEGHADWFASLGISIAERDSASLVVAPKPKAGKPKAGKAKPAAPAAEEVVP